MTDTITPITNHDWQDATIERLAVETPTVKSIVLRPRVFQPFLAGQHIDVRLTASDGYEAHRSYSICSSPHTVGTIELAIEALPDGEVSSYFHNIAAVGDVVEIRGPFTTHFVWHPRLNGEVLLIGGGSGVAPLMSMVRERSYSADAPRMTLVYSSRSWREVIFLNELLHHEKTQRGFRLYFCITRDTSHAPENREADFTERLDAISIRRVIAEMLEMPQNCFVCGNNSFVGTVSDSLVVSGIPAQAIRTERYGG